MVPTLHILLLSMAVVLQSRAALCDPMDCSRPGFPVLRHFPEPAQTHVHWVSDAIQPPHPLSSRSRPASIFPSIRVFSNESALCIKWPKYWSFSFSLSPSNEYSRLISFRIDWFALLAVQGTLKSLLQHLKRINSMALSFLYSPTLTSIHDYWKNHSFDYTGVCWQSDVYFLNRLSRLVIDFLPRSKRLLISWLQSPSAVILEPKKRKSVTVSIVSPTICHEVMGQDAMMLVFWMLSFKPAFSFFPLTFSKSLFSSSLLSALRVVSSAYLRLLIFLPAILILVCVSPSPVFHTMYSAYKLNKWDGNMQPWCNPFPVWN